MTDFIVDSPENGLGVVAQTCGILAGLRQFVDPGEKPQTAKRQRSALQKS
jgi:hypothetical protein